MADFTNLKKGDRIIITDGLVGGTSAVTVQSVHLEEELVLYMDKDGEAKLAFFEDIIKKL